MKLEEKLVLLRKEKREKGPEPVGKDRGKSLMMRPSKRYLAIFLGSLLAVLLLELLCYPLSSRQFTEAAQVKTMGSLMALTEESPRQLRIYHRAFLLPRYRLDCTLEVPKADLKTANVDLFQECAVSVEGSKIVLYAQKNSFTPFFLLVSFLVFTILLDQTWDVIRPKAGNKRGTNT